jgi:uncharacterized membrane protein YgcG
LANCGLLAWDSARRVALLPRTRRGRVPRAAAAAEGVRCAGRCVFAALPFLLFQARPACAAAALLCLSCRAAAHAMSPHTPPPQAWAFQRFCAGRWAKQPRPWCSRPLPLIYTFVQEHYWHVHTHAHAHTHVGTRGTAYALTTRLFGGHALRCAALRCARRDVGFLRYFRAEQLPNFALAAPVLALTAAGVAAYVRADVRRAMRAGLAVSDAARRGKPRELAALEEAAPLRAADQRARCVTWRPHCMHALRAVHPCAARPLTHARACSVVVLCIHVRRMQHGELVPFGFPPPPPKPPLSPASPRAPPSPASSAGGGGVSGGGARRRRGKSSGGGGGGGGGGGNSSDASPAPSPAPTPPRASPGRAGAPPAAAGALPALPAIVLTSSREPIRRAERDAAAAPEWGYLASAALPHVALWGALALPALLAMHVQVATRFLSSCPALYWYAAHLCGGRRTRLGRAVWAYFLAYAAVGTVLFVNFYPWT